MWYNVSVIQDFLRERKVLIDTKFEILNSVEDINVLLESVSEFISFFKNLL